MITLYGVALSPYYNKVKIALIEKGVNFREQFAAPAQTPEVLALSPMGKIPYVDINGFRLAESSAIVEWLEDAYPTASLMPPTPNGRARARELALLIELYLIAPCEPLVMHLLFGRPLSDTQRDTARAQLERGLTAVASRVGENRPWLLGDDFTVADIAAAAMLPHVASLSERLLGEDLTTAFPDRDAYLARLGRRPSVAKVWQDREEQLHAFLNR